VGIVSYTGSLLSYPRSARRSSEWPAAWRAFDQNVLRLFLSCS